MYIYTKLRWKLWFCLISQKSLEINNVLQFMLIIAYPNWHPRDIFANFTKKTNFGIVKTSSCARRERKSEKLQMLLFPREYWWFWEQNSALFQKFQKTLSFKTLIVTFWVKITKIWKSRSPTIKKRQQIYRYFTTFSKLQNICFRDPSSHFWWFFDGDFMVFRGNVAQKLFPTVVFWLFSSTFSDFRAKSCKNPT